MAYKVEYYTLAKLNDGGIGNVLQTKGTCYTGSPISEIEHKLNEQLDEKKQICVIEKIETVTGFIL